MADLKFCTDAMGTAVENYTETADKMSELRDKLEKEIDTLASTDWQSDAGQKFADTYQNTWAQNVGKYVEVLRELADILSKAAKEYDQLVEKANTLKIDAI